MTDRLSFEEHFVFGDGSVERARETAAHVVTDEPGGPFLLSFADSDDVHELVLRRDGFRFDVADAVAGEVQTSLFALGELAGSAARFSRFSLGLPARCGRSRFLEDVLRRVRGEMDGSLPTVVVDGAAKLWILLAEAIGIGHRTELDFRRHLRITCLSAAQRPG